MRRLVVLVASLLLVAVLQVPRTAPPPSYGQAVDVYINITGGGGKKLNIAIPDFAVIAGPDGAGVAPMLASVAGADLTFSRLFNVVAASVEVREKLMR